jgi:hypothetical protein
VRPAAHRGYNHAVHARDTRYEQIDPQRSVEYRDPSEFDRIAFAMRALRRLRPKRMTVAVYSAVSALRVERGRDLRRGEGATVAIVGIPPHASREHIAYALAELAGIESVPYAVNMLLADDGADECA